MSVRLSRRKMAHYVADKLTAGIAVDKALQEVAAYLITSRRIRERDLLVRDIEEEMATRGVVVADVTSAHTVDASIKTAIQKMTGAQDVQLRMTTDESLLGGVRIDVPGKRFDGTIRSKLNALKARKL